jgi:hypothetical protein
MIRTVQTEASPEFVTTEQCKTNRRVTRTIQVITVVLFSGFISLAAWSISAGKMASDSALEVNGNFNTHVARQEERDVRIEDTLLRVESEVVMQRKMLEDIWKSKGKP